MELEQADGIPSTDISDEAVGQGLMHAIGELPQDERDIAVMFYIYGIKIKDIAAELDMPIGTVKWRLNKIRAALSEKLS